MAALRPVVGYCEFVGLSALGDLVGLAHAADRCAAEATAVLGRHGGTTERVLYDRLVAVFMAPRSAVGGFLELQRAIHALDLDLAAGLADGDSCASGWGRGHIAARALAQAARRGEVLLDEPLRLRLGEAVRCVRAGEPLEGLAAWRLLSVS